MRLTLRTLLAYLDDFLEPDDSEDIAKKIEESEFATQLVHRTRDCMRRLRLGVPPVMGRGLAADPNTVAEYLDNTLAADRVPEFEKICLESDVHLAEVASCHQILTLVLGGVVEIPPEARQMMYSLPARVDAPPVQTDAIRQPASVAVAPGAAVPPPVQTAARRPKPEVPEYLRESSRSRMVPVAATVAVAAVLTFGILVLLNPMGMRDRVIAIAQNSEVSDEQANKQANGADATESEDRSDSAPTPAADTAPSELTVPPVAGGEDADAPQAPGPDEVSAGAEGQQSADEEMPEADKDSTARDAASEDTADNMPASPAREMPDEPGTVTPPADVPVADAATEPDLAAGDAQTKPAAAARSDAEEEGFGRYTSKHEVLLRYDAGAGDWKRLQAMSPLVKGDRLLSLPLFRPTITLSSNITVQPDGAALMQLVGWTDSGVPIIAVEFGRLLLMTVGKAGNSLQARFDDRDMQLTFVDAESTAALDARRVLPPGKDPTAEPAPLLVEVYATSGSLRIRQGQSSTELAAPGRKALFGGAEVFGAEFPKWATSAEPLSDSERRAATTIEPLLPADDRPVGLKLKELAGDRRREVRSLAIRSACYLDNFDACIAALNDPQEKTLWTGLDAPYIVELKVGVARAPETANKIRDALEKQRGAEAAGLYRMLWGYSAEDLKSGADPDLVDGLDKESLDYRVLAFWNLQNITGLPPFGYHPVETSFKRRAALKAWQARLKEGKIVPKSGAASARPKGSTGKSAERGAL